MTPSRSPFEPPADAANPGLLRPVLGLILVFVLGMACVGLILAFGEPIEPATTAPPLQAPDAPPPAEPTEPESVPNEVAPTGEAYTAPGGANPMPRHGEPDAPPIPPTTLIDDAALNAPPPTPSTLPAPDGPVPWDQADQYLEQVITVRGTIVDTHLLDSGRLCFLNFDTDWQDNFYIAMFQEAFALLPDPPQEHYLNKTLLVTGKVTLHRGRPQIEVRDAAQVEVVEE